MEFPAFHADFYGLNKGIGLLRFAERFDDISNFLAFIGGNRTCLVNGSHIITGFDVGNGNATVVAAVVVDVVGGVEVVIVVIVVVRGNGEADDNTVSGASHASPFVDLLTQSSTLHVLAGQ